jgi:Trypsin-like peptidase domain
MQIDDAIHGISTIIKVQTASGSSQGSGFYYQALDEKDPEKKEQWVQIKDTWLVTNRHVAFPRINNNEETPDIFTFHLRKVVKDGVVWEPIHLRKDEFISRSLLHPNPEVDICVINVLDLLSAKVKTGEQYLQWYAVSSDNQAGKNKINPHVASDAVVIGYPRGFYDQVNLFPIVKSGIIASRWGALFDGKPYFLIDSKLFPGSSGSIVISKPTDVVVEDGNIFHSKDKQFAFLGVFSGEPFQQHQPLEFDDLTIIRKSGFNVGIVWYGSLIEEIIKNGVRENKT